ncbi:MAG: preprotein translocase subunit SecG [Verrucomicrobia bacterium]|nr:preprotein translocase subunit SecG [Verrucomicrobiota bacterium]
MNILITLLTVFEVIVCLLLSLLVLMQRPRQEGLGAAFGSGVTDQMFGAQTTNVLQKATVYLGVALFGLTFLLAILVSRQDDHTTGKATFVEPTDKVVTPVAGKDGPGMSEEALRKLIDEQVSKKTGDEKAPTPPAESAADKPVTPAPIPAPTTSTTPPAAPVPEAPAPVK